MNTLLRALADDAALRYAANLALGAAAASTMGLLIAKMARRSAALRQGLLTATIVVVAAQPLLVLPQWRGGLIRAGSTVARAPDYRAENSPAFISQGETAPTFPQNVPGKERVSPLQPPPVERARMAAAFPVGKLLWGGLMVWGFGGVWYTFLAVRSLIALRRVRAGVVDAGSAWAFQAKQAAEAVGLTQAPRVALAVAAGVPFSMGGRQPLILLPESAREMEAAEAEAILLHEAGHIAHRHHLLGLLMTAVEILYWWLPPVRWTNAALADAMEEVCDNHVLRVQGDGRALGRCLVNAAEAAANGVRTLPGSAILHGRRGLSCRLARVLEGVGNKETGMSKFQRATSVLVALVCMGVCAMVRVVPAEAEEGAEIWARYFPMTVGSEWTYRATSPGRQKSGERRLKVWGRLPLKKGGACVEIETIEEGRRDGFLYAGMRRDGYYAYPNAPLGMQGVNEDAAPIPLALFPLVVGRSWTWQEPRRPQMALEGGDDPETEGWGSACRATVEKTDEEVTVPAGRYHALRIRIQRKSKHFGASEEIDWYAKGVGPVRREIWVAGQNTPTSVVELTHFAPGTRQAEVPEELLPLVRKMSAGKAPLRALRTLPLGNGRFVDHFAVSQGENGIRIFYRTAGGKAIVFDPLQGAEWKRLQEEDGSEKPLLGPTGGISFAQEIGILMAEGLGMETDAKTYLDKITTKGLPDGGTEINFAVKGFPGRWSSWRLYIWIEVSQQGEITAVKFGPYDAADQGQAPAKVGSPR